MTIDEAIEHAREVAETCECEASKYDMCDSYEREVAYQEGKCAEEHEQLAEWLEELKAFKKNKWTDIYIKRGYNKAIDDFVKASREVVYNYYTEQAYIKYDDFCKIAERLKEKI